MSVLNKWGNIPASKVVRAVQRIGVKEVKCAVNNIKWESRLIIWDCLGNARGWWEICLKSLTATHNDMLF